MRIDVVPVGGVDAEALDSAADALEEHYGADVVETQPVEVPDGAFDARTRQYNAERLIDVATREGRGDVNIGLTDVDVFYRQRNYVFGLAYLEGSGAMVSTHRLRMTADGGSLEDDHVTFLDRVRKEVVHEVGHTLGLRHCDNDLCVMSFSPTVSEVDRKFERPCTSCHPR